MSILALGILAAVIQTIGYLTYGLKIFKRDIQPNATSWLMFAYGTSLLTVVEWDREASWPLLILPASCAVMSIVIAFYCLRKAHHVWWPNQPLERSSFLLDVLLTILYIVAWILVASDLISELQKERAEVLILICWNIGVFTAFFPLLRQVYHHPLTEHALPWYLWTIAYALLFIATYWEQGTFNELMLYPYTHLIVHGAIAAHTGYAHYKVGRAIL